MTESKGDWQEFEVSGRHLLDKVSDLIHEGNIRRIRIIHDGQTLLELPLTVLAVGTLLAPQLAALGALAALLANCTIAVERQPPPAAPETQEEEMASTEGNESDPT
jgi:hypothetical protein